MKKILERKWIKLSLLEKAWGTDGVRRKKIIIITCIKYESMTLFINYCFSFYHSTLLIVGQNYQFIILPGQQSSTSMFIYRGACHPNREDSSLRQIVFCVQFAISSGIQSLMVQLERICALRGT